MIGDRRSREQKAKQERLELLIPRLVLTVKQNTLEIMVNGHNDNTPFYRFRREKELAKVTIKKEDVELIVSI